MTDGLTFLSTDLEPASTNNCNMTLSLSLDDLEAASHQYILFIQKCSPFQIVRNSGFKLSGKYDFETQKFCCFTLTPGRRIPHSEISNYVNTWEKFGFKKLGLLELIVIDILSPKSCSCKTEDDKYLDDVSPSMLETVIPRDESAYVMIVKGKYTGELCTILKKDKSKCVATVQLLSDRSQALKIEYDSICEYVGDVTQFD